MRLHSQKHFGNPPNPCYQPCVVEIRLGENDCLFEWGLEIAASQAAKQATSQSRTLGKSDSAGIKGLMSVCLSVRLKTSLEAEGILQGTRGWRGWRTHGADILSPRNLTPLVPGLQIPQRVNCASRDKGTHPARPGLQNPDWICFRRHILTTTTTKLSCLYCVAGVHSASERTELTTGSYANSLEKTTR